MLALAVLAVLLSDVSATSRHYNLTQELRSRDVFKGLVPPGDGVEPFTVNVSFVPLDVLDIDDAKQVVSLSTTLNLLWRDPNLAWDSSPSGPYGGIEKLELSAQELWTPIVYIMNGASEARNVDMGTRVTLLPNGTVLLTASPLMKFTCSMNLKVYPFDTQQCKLILFVHSAYPVMSKMDESSFFSERSIFSSFSVNGEWTLDGVDAESREIVPQMAYLEYMLKMRRKTTFYVISFIVPVVLTSYMNTLVFVIPAESGERVSYLVSIFVSNAVFVSFCTDQMPQGLDSVPLVIHLQLGIMLQSAILIILVSHLQRRSFRLQRHDVNDDAAGSQNVGNRGSGRKVAWSKKNATAPSPTRLKRQSHVTQEKAEMEN